MKQSLNDKKLINSYLSGDKSALTALVSKWHLIFCEKAFWIVKDKELAKDVAQESWLVIINKLPSLRNQERFKSWALRIIYTKAIDAHKNKLRNANSLDNTVIAFAKDESEEVELRKLRLHKAIKHLPLIQQEILRLFYVESYSIKEISVLLQIPLGTVKSRLFKSREKLKSILK